MLLGEAEADVAVGGVGALALARLAPDDPDVYKEMGMICLNARRDMAAAQEYFRMSLALNPNQPELSAIMNPQPQAQRPHPDQQGPALPGFGPPMPGLPLPEMPQLPQAPNLPKTPQE